MDPDEEADGFVVAIFRKICDKEKEVGRAAR
jgi:hypothetical protein